MDDTFPPLPGADIRETAMKTIYILLTRSGTLLSKLVYSVTGANYTHASLAFDEDLSCLYSSTRKNGYTMFPAGPSREYLDRGVFRLRPEAPCALYWQRRRHYFCSQFVSDVLEKSGALELPKDSTLMHPNDYTQLGQLRCVYEGRLSGLPQRQNMDFGGDETVVSVYLGLALGLVKAGVRQIF